MPSLLPESLVEQVAERFRVLGDATRLSILHLLLQRGELNVGEICAALGASQANVSKHLRTLHAAGIVVRDAPRAPRPTTASPTPRSPGSATSSAIA